MKKIEIEVIKGMCSHNMRIEQVARSMYVHRNTVVYHIKQIREKTGLDATKFYDLIKLDILSDQEPDDRENEKPEKLCIYCGVPITSDGWKYCSKECMKKHYAEKRSRMRKQCMECVHSKSDGNGSRRCELIGKTVITSKGTGYRNMKYCPLNKHENDLLSAENRIKT